MAISGTYGANLTEYRTEIDSFYKIISYGTAGNGPAYFKLWTKGGEMMEFGNSADSAVEAQGKSTIRVRALNKLQDTKGNYLLFSMQKTVQMEHIVRRRSIIPAMPPAAPRVSAARNRRISERALCDGEPQAQEDGAAVITRCRNAKT